MASPVGFMYDLEMVNDDGNKHLEQGNETGRTGPIWNHGVMEIRTSTYLLAGISPSLRINRAGGREGKRRQPMGLTGKELMAYGFCNGSRPMGLPVPHPSNKHGAL